MTNLKIDNYVLVLRDLEPLIDAFGLCAVLNHISEVCGEKAEHIESAWQDRLTAGSWKRARMTVERCAESANVLAVS